MKSPGDKFRDWLVLAETTITEEQFRELVFMYESIQDPVKTHYPERKNLIPFCYCLEKFCELLGLGDVGMRVRYSPGVTHKLDSMWSTICSDMGWFYQRL